MSDCVVRTRCADEMKEIFSCEGDDGEGQRAGELSHFLSASIVCSVMNVYSSSAGDEMLHGTTLLVVYDIQYAEWGPVGLWFDARFDATVVASLAQIRTSIFPPPSLFFLAPFARYALFVCVPSSSLSLRCSSKQAHRKLWRQEAVFFCRECLWVINVEAHHAAYCRTIITIVLHSSNGSIPVLQYQVFCITAVCSRRTVVV